MKKNKNKEELNHIDFGAYVRKDLFLHKLKMHEIRLCVFLTSKKDKTIINLTHDEKLWISASSCRATTKELKCIESKLISLGLLDESGKGKKLEKGQYCLFSDINDLYECKTQREFFILCLCRWNGNKSFKSIKKEYIYNIFGENVRIRNQNIKRTLKSMSINITFNERVNDFLYTVDGTKKSEVIEENNSYNIENNYLNINLIEEESKDEIIDPLSIRLERLVNGQYSN